MRVLIIGAGLGGLCLAHGLRRAGVDALVFERRPSPADQPASYGIHLNADGLSALHACLPAENWEQLIGAAAPAHDIIRFWDAKLRPLAVNDRETPRNAADPITRRRAVARDVLRDALLRGFNTEARGSSDIVHWGKEFVRYEQADGGQVRIHFADGSHATGDLLVGADGSNSRVRKQRLPALDRADLGILNVAGRLALTSSVARRLPPTLTDGSINNIVPSGPGWMFVSTWRAAQCADSESYLVWAWVGSKDSYPTGVDGMPPEALRDHVIAHIKDWAPGVQSMVTETKTSTIARVPLRTMLALENWEPSNVTLLGDAIHNMTPMAGIGANTALRDADQLRRSLTGSAGVLDGVASYEREMRRYANEALATSTRNARSAASESRVQRFGFRTLLRIAEATPVAKRVIFGGARYPQ